MSVDVATEMTRMWLELRKSLDTLDATSSEKSIEKFLDRVVVLGGVERQTLYSDLEECDDDADVVTKQATRRWNKIQKAMEKLHLPPNEKTWRAFVGAMVDHLDHSPRDIGARLATLSKDDRADLGERVKVMRETLS